MKFLKTAVKIFKKILFVAECCILAHILVFWICWTISEIYSRIVHTDQQILSAILFHSDEIVILIFFIEVTVFINYTAFRLFEDIFEIDKKVLYYGIGFVSTSSIFVYILHRMSQYYSMLSAEPLNFIFCVSAVALFYYAYAGMGRKRRCADSQSDDPASQVKGSCLPDETLPGQTAAEENRKKKRDLAVKATGIFLMAASSFELMMNLLPSAGIPAGTAGSADSINCFPMMSMLLLVYAIAVAHRKYSGYVFLTPRMLAWIVCFLSFMAIVFLSAVIVIAFLQYPYRMCRKNEGHRPVQ